MSKLNAGDKVAYAAKFLRTISASKGMADRRGVYVGLAPGMEKTHGCVHWDDEAALIASGQGNYAEQDYCDHVRANGSLVALGCIAKVGSVAFND
jgi:hypothetical protein